MMKKYLFAVLAAMMMAMQAGAQEVKVPRFEKFVKINKAGVNLRKGPSTQSPKLLARDYEQESMIMTEFSWTAKAGAKPFALEAGSVVPVISEDGLWYHIYVDVESAGSSAMTDAYIRRDFCTPVEPMRIAGGDDAPYARFDVGRPYKAKGNAGLYIAYCENEMDGNDAMIGKAFGFGVAWMGYEGFYEYLESLCAKNNYGGLIIDMNKITEARLQQFMKTHKAYGCNVVSYQFWGSDGQPEIASWSFNAGGKLPMVTRPEVYDIEKFVVSASGQPLQMRQKPSLSAPKLVFVQEPDQTMYKVGNLDWETSLLDKSRIESLSSKVFAVVGEEGDWYQVYDSYHLGPVSHTSVGYIQKKDVRDATVKPITEPVLKDSKYWARNNENARLLTAAGNNTFVVMWGCPRINGICSLQCVNVGLMRNNLALMLGDQVVLYDDGKMTIGSVSFPGNRLINSDTSLIDGSKLTAADVAKLYQNGGDYFKELYVNIEDTELHVFEIDGLNGRKVDCSNVLK